MHTSDNMCVTSEVCNVSSSYSILRQKIFIETFMTLSQRTFLTQNSPFLVNLQFALSSFYFIVLCSCYRCIMKDWKVLLISRTMSIAQTN